MCVDSRAPFRRERSTRCQCSARSSGRKSIGSRKRCANSDRSRAQQSNDIGQTCQITLPELVLAGWISAPLLCWLLGGLRASATASAAFGRNGLGWLTLFADLHVALFAVPGGLYVCFSQASSVSLYVAALALLSLLLVGISETAMPFAGALSYCRRRRRLSFVLCRCIVKTAIDQRCRSVSAPRSAAASLHAAISRPSRPFDAANDSSAASRPRASSSFSCS